MERTQGLYQLLARPAVYSLFQDTLGVEEGRRRFAEEFVRIKPGQRLLDIGCGPGDLFRVLPPGVSYVGYDVNPKYIESAKKNYGDRAEFRQDTVAKATTEAASFDLVVAVGVLHHLTDDDVMNLMRSADHALRPGGRLVTIDGGYLDGQNPIARFLVSRDRGQHVRTRDGYETLARKVFPQVQVTIKHDLLRVPYTHVVLECSR